VVVCVCVVVVVVVVCVCVCVRAWGCMDRDAMKGEVCDGWMGSFAHLLPNLTPLPKSVVRRVRPEHEEQAECTELAAVTSGG
jgi:hypothetical protein